jgi:hypothetical protein
MAAVKNPAGARLPVSRAGTQLGTEYEQALAHEGRGRP